MRYTGISYSLLFIIMCGGAHAYTVDSDAVFKDENYTVPFGGTFINYGEIDVTNFYLCPGCSVDIINYGIINADNFIVPSDAAVRHVITSNETAKNIGGFVGFDTIVRDGNNLSLTSVAHASDGAGHVIFENVSLDIDGPFLMDGTIAEFRDMVTLNFNSMTDLPDDGVIFKNLINNGRIVIKAPNTDSMYAWRVNEDIPRGIISVNKIRETDYTRFMAPDLGNYLNSLRGDVRNDEFMSRLDNAANMDEIESILSHSAHTNPMKLMDAISGVNNSVTFNMVDNFAGRSAYLRPMVLINDTSILYGVRTGVGFNVMDKLNVGVHAHAGYMDVMGELDEYAANMFGGGLHLNWNDEFIIARMMMGATVVNFDIDSVYDNGHVFESPTGVSIYSAGDVGANIRMPYNIFVTPTVGFDNVRDSIADSDRNNFRMNVASDLGIDCAVYDIRYRYAFRTRVYSNGDIGYGLRVTVNSDADNIGGDASIMQIQHDDVTSTEISAMVRISF